MCSDVGLCLQEASDTQRRRIALTGYTWYQMSAMKRVVDGAAAAKARYNETKVAVAETRETVKVKAADVSASVNEKSSNIKERLRRYRSNAPQKAENVCKRLRSTHASAGLINQIL